MRRTKDDNNQSFSVEINMLLFYSFTLDLDATRHTVVTYIMSCLATTGGSRRAAHCYATQNGSDKTVHLVLTGRNFDQSHSRFLALYQGGTAGNNPPGMSD